MALRWTPSRSAILTSRRQSTFPVDSMGAACAVLKGLPQATRATRATSHASVRLAVMRWICPIWRILLIWRFVVKVLDAWAARTVGRPGADSYACRHHCSRLWGPPHGYESRPPYARPTVA